MPNGPYDLPTYPVDPRTNLQQVDPAEWMLAGQVTHRIGVERLWVHAVEERWAVSLDNRTYHHMMVILPNRLREWQRAFGL